MDRLYKDILPYIVIIVVVILIRSFVVTPVVVRGASMDDTLKDGQVLFLSKISYHIGKIKRFDIIVIKDNDDDLIIKRVIGLPGDNVSYKDNKLYINGKEMKDKYANGETNDFTLQNICEINGDDCVTKIPNNMYLALGDNREISADSRVKGLFGRKQILGKVVLRIWPISKINFVK